jgi:hypothetical protein
MLSCLNAGKFAGKEIRVFGASRAKCAYVNAELETPALVYLGSMANPQPVVAK